MRQYLKLHTVLVTNDKVMRQLASDAARWHYVKVLVAAKKADPEGEWDSIGSFRLAVGEETFAYLDEFMCTEPEGLLVVDEAGRLYVRQWTYWQCPDAKVKAGEMPPELLAKRRAQDRVRSQRYRDRRAKEKENGTEGEVNVKELVRDAEPSVAASPRTARAPSVASGERVEPGAVATARLWCVDCGRDIEPGQRFGRYGDGSQYHLPRCGEASEDLPF